MHMKAGLKVGIDKELILGVAGKLSSGFGFMYYKSRDEVSEMFQPHHAVN